MRGGRGAGRGSAFKCGHGAVRAGRPTCAGASFAKRRRLLRGSQFRFVFDRAWQSRGLGLRVFARPNDGDCDRIGIAVSRKVDSNAVGRNRIKRQVREFFRCIGSDGSERWLDVVVVAQKPCADMDNAAIRGELDQHWQRLMRRYRRTA